MKINVRSKLPPDPTAQDVFDILVKHRLAIRYSPLAIRDYLSPPHPSSLSLVDFGFENSYIDQAMKRIWRCHPDHPENIHPHKPIVVYTDYDADGITGGAILWETLHTLGFQAFPYTPNRITEGYGFSTQGLDAVKEKYDPALIISVDHGITADSMVQYALEKLGIPIIVTDHHHRQEEKVPKLAKAIFHIPALSGSGVAYYVGKEISNSARFMVHDSRSNDNPQGKVENYLSSRALRPCSVQAPSRDPSIPAVSAGGRDDNAGVVQSTKGNEREQNTVIAKHYRRLPAFGGKQSHISESSTRDLEYMFEHDYVGIAAIGTIADLVPLQGPSRSIAYHGLKVLTDTKRPGLVALKKVSDHIGKTVTTYEVGFLLAPRINASGRLEDALDALRLLCTKDGMKARSLAEKLNALNIQRQDMVKKAVEEALIIVESKKDADGNLPRILIIHQNYDSESSQPDLLNTSMPTMWHEGIIGLIASKVCEKYHRPTIVLTSTDNGESSFDSAQDKLLANSEKNSVMVSLSNHDTTPASQHILKASCRSISGFHMTEYLSAHKELLIKFGGHEMAAGFSMSEDKLAEFTAQSEKYADSHITHEMLERTISVDCELPLGLASIEFADMLEQMAPFGMGNAKPVFMSSGKIMNVQTMGREQKHARFRLSQGTEGLDFVAFGKAEEILDKSKEDAVFNIVYTLDINRWNGSEKVQGKLITVDS